MDNGVTLTQSNVMYNLVDCLSSEVDSITVTPGSLILCRDSGEAYYDTPEGDRVHVAKTVIVFRTDAERTALDFPDIDTLYIVVATRGMWIYSGQWIRLNEPQEVPIYLFNQEIKANTTTPIVCTDCYETSNVKFDPIPELLDLYDSTKITFSPYSGYINCTSTLEYNMIGTFTIVTPVE